MVKSVTVPGKCYTISDGDKDDPFRKVDPPTIKQHHRTKKGQ